MIGGVLQGRKQFDVRGASRVCKRRMWKLAIEIAGLAAVPVVESCLYMTMYGDVKSSGCLTQRIKVKDDARKGALKGWIRNAGGEEFGVDSVEV